MSVVGSREYSRVTPRICMDCSVSRRVLASPLVCDDAITSATRSPAVRTAAASSTVMRGLPALRSWSSSVRDGPDRCTMKVSAPTREVIESDTEAFSPCTSDTTAMIEVTATMLPSTVRNDRSLFDQIAWRAMLAAS